MFYFGAFWKERKEQSAFNRFACSLLSVQDFLAFMFIGGHGFFGNDISPVKTWCNNGNGASQSIIVLSDCKITRKFLL